LNPVRVEVVVDARQSKPALEVANAGPIVAATEVAGIFGQALPAGLLTAS
jgi:hypothetical protein